MPSDIPLFGRYFKVQVHDVVVEGLKCTFTVEKHLKPDPNTLDLNIYNLSQSNRKRLEGLPNKTEVKVSLEAGYLDGISQIYLGDVRYIISSAEGSDVITKITSGDGEQKVQTSRVSIPVGAQTDVQTAISKIAFALGIGEGNLGLLATPTGRVILFPRGGVIHGNAAVEMTAICRSAGLEWSIQDGVLQVLNINETVSKKFYVLSSSTGMVGTPKVDNTGLLEVSCLMLPDMVPGRHVVLDAIDVKGSYRIEECKYTGDTHGNDWKIDLKCKPV